MSTTIEMKLKEIIVRISKKEIMENLITKDLDLISDLDFDSMQIVELIVETENEFNIIIEDEDMDLEILSKFCNLNNMIEKRLISL